MKVYDPNCLDWSLERRLDHAIRMIELTIDRYPDLAERWFRDADHLRALMSAEPISGLDTDHAPRQIHDHNL